MKVLCKVKVIDLKTDEVVNYETFKKFHDIIRELFYIAEPSYYTVEKVYLVEIDSVNRVCFINAYNQHKDLEMIVRVECMEFSWDGVEIDYSNEKESGENE